MEDIRQNLGFRGLLINPGKELIGKLGSKDKGKVFVIFPVDGVAHIVEGRGQSDYHLRILRF
jgi:hypothetical protein